MHDTRPENSFLEDQQCRWIGSTVRLISNFSKKQRHEGPGSFSPIERTQFAVDTVTMARKPKRPAPSSWDIYRIAEKSTWLGSVDAPDKQTAIEKGAQEFKAEAWRLYAVARR
jgi:hypothetical protein